MRHPCRFGALVGGTAQTHLICCVERYLRCGEEGGKAHHYENNDVRPPHFSTIKWVIPCLCALSLMHGCQDGQKFIGILKAFVSNSDTHPDFFTNLSIILPVGAAMLLGSLLGGKRIINTYKSTSVEDSLGYFISSDVTTIFSILVCSLFGMAVSTGIVKLFSLVGSSLGFGKRVNKKVATSTLLVAVATLPICFFLGYLLALLLNGYF